MLINQEHLEGVATAAASNFPPFKLQYNRRQVADLLNISLRTVDRLIAEKQLTARHIGSRVLVPRESLLSFTRLDHVTESVQ